MATPHHELLADLLQAALEALQAVQARATDAALRQEAEQVLGPVQAVHDALRNEASVVLTQAGIALLLAGVEASVAAMRRQHPWIAVLPDLRGEEVH